MVPAAEDLPEEVSSIRKRQRSSQLAIGVLPPKSEVVLSNQSKAFPVPALSYTVDANQSNDSVLERLLPGIKGAANSNLVIRVGLARIRLRLGEPYLT